ncbi:Hypothetical protein YbgI [Halorhodospira halochloris]|uniref:Nif3-like dinuclear metal center hexameric protein n=1 Tax=Halorhodospira halochloris TaxID=1052 RepID=A0A0X8XAN3_HALHR|nr:Nif3-like dinuclear metal center hexameric protein [Halorhodospira halochloris]MBK1651667.1 Nif3-like dinuclear metal center hexameric protein [Halorhodospira halochloris]BAU58531.1 Hypothetical protein YbgI [Halorhodospira halochloris]
MLHRDQLEAYLNDYLSVESISDYAPNGLQVEGREEIGRLVTGVSACASLLEKAEAAKADAILVHHGYFWKGEENRIVGYKARRLRRLLCSGMNLFAYHLPLDVHLEVGNNAALGDMLELTNESRYSIKGIPDLLWFGVPGQELSANQLSQRLESVLGQAPLHVGSGPGLIRRIAWCSGGAERLIEQACAYGADAFISGEISEPIPHIAREAGIHYFAAGHHATERGGVQRLGEHIAAKFDIDHQYIEIANPA